MVVKDFWYPLERYYQGVDTPLLEVLRCSIAVKEVFGTAESGVVGDEEYAHMKPSINVRLVPFV
jgi:hypothetical protein